MHIVLQTFKIMDFQSDIGSIDGLICSVYGVRE